VRSIQPLVDRFAETNLAGPPPGLHCESVEVVVWAQVRETINRVTGLKQQVRKSLATPEEAYIFGGMHRQGAAKNGPSGALQGSPDRTTEKSGEPKIKSLHPTVIRKRSNSRRESGKSKRKRSK
jgi:hypothetical protein